MRSHGYDNDGLLTGAGDETITSDPGDGLITGSTLGGVNSALTYDGFGEPQTDTVTNGATNLYSVGYTRDNLGRITQKIETVNGTTTTWLYGYDADGRLNAVTENGLPVASYGYDQNGNRVSVNAAIIASYDNQDRLLTFGSNSYSYNANGELLTKANSTGTTSYTWDALGNLLGAKLPSGTAITYLYDGQNRLVGKQVNGKLTEGFLYDGQLEPVAELDGSGNVVEQFVYGSRPNVPDYIIKGGAEYKVISDQVGSPVLIVNASTGAIAEQISYDAWGNITSDSNPGFQPFGFAGGLYDADTGLVHFGARDYDPQTGRWISKDPILFAGGETNLYGYVVGDPINGLDPLGLFCLGCHLPTLPTSFENWAVGTADALSFNIGKIIRDEYDLGSPDLNTCSPAYFAGKLTGTAVNAAIGGVAAARSAAWAAANARPLGRAALLIGSLFTRAPDANVITPIVDVVKAEQNMQAFSEGATLETEAQRLAASHIETPPPGG
ncbi:MAG TPA: RHS repeat-associated core domain-containing protein [Candidatus Saccharimonadales bacterium]|nr:RHS repeat-associated core domain-containing protein [Candidatus Saccharimonadales bacterium]